MKKIRLILLAMSVGLIAACTTPRSPAPVVERTTSNKPLVPAPAKPTQKPVEERGYYTVKKGDTLIHIALEVGQNYRDLVAWNNLANANDIKVDQVLRVLPPDSSAGTGAPQTGSVAITSGIEVRPLSTTPPNASAPVATTAVPSAALANNKSSPRADKRPYSETALAELRKPDSAPALPLIAKLEPARQPEMRTTDKVPEAPEEEAVAWMWPAEGKVVANFDDGKKGIDIAGKSGQQVLAAGAGKVMYAGSGIRGYGNLVIVKHTNTLLSAYAHNKTILVKEGQSVSRGQKIAEMGNSDADAVKLHFEIRQQGKPVDPSKFLPAK
jgi:lipoprotein NlpD